MHKTKSIISLENEITVLREKLDSVVKTERINSDNVLELSRKLDVLIVGYYNLKNTVSS